MLLGNAQTTLCHRRFDLSHPALIFGGLLLTATAICGTLQVPATPVMPIEGVIVLNDENVVAPEGIDPFAVTCDVKDVGGSSSIRRVSNGTTPADCQPDARKDTATSVDAELTSSGSTSSVSGSLH